ncbi:MAG: hypothetical protein Q4G03_02945 [Planctomycetia bacterium]|nr:hypothetical protein [Planctomycetia bacterium]
MTTLLVAPSLAQSQTGKNSASARAGSTRAGVNLSTQFVNPDQNVAEKEQADESPEQEEAQQPEESSEESAEQTPQEETPRLTFLELERKARLQAPELFKNLVGLKAYKKRLPSGWRALNLTQKQTEEIYKLDEEYHKEIAQLQARIERLNQERERQLRTLLKPSQLQRLNGGEQHSDQESSK